MTDTAGTEDARARLSPYERRSAIAADKLGSLEALRGAAALGVVVYHWLHFSAVDISEFAIQSPFSAALLPFYRFGWVLVDFFFLLSGFVFSFVYSRAIHENRVSVHGFWVARFARLYPLHILTLIMVRVLQALHYRQFETFFVYPNNDTTHFLLNLLMLSDTPLASGLSFNGPVWSITIEVALYVMFFLLARMTSLSLGLCFVMVAMGIGLYISGFNHLGRGVMSFFLGGAAFVLVDRMRSSASALFFARLALVAAFGSCSVVVAELHFNGWDRLLLAVAPGGVSANSETISLVANKLRSISCVFLVFPLLLIGCALRELLGARPGAWADWLGALSYSAYLWHVPVQISMALVATIDFRDPWMFSVYIASVIIVSMISFRFFEAPMRRMIRRRLS